MGTIGQTPGKDIFLLLVHHSGFLRACYQSRTAEDHFWLCCRVEAEALIGPQMSIPTPDILVSMLLRTLHHAAKMPKEATWACPGPDARCTHWTVQLSLKLFRFWPGMDNNATKRLD